ncbi:pyruvate/2-oxoglutarate dehydrogenase complex dihydrolipoamide dehydrogenase (E3) component [Pedobacter sp. UYP30]|uniref:dihydrolipoyl dehydrogenase family protein n=1 Tax=Pedobacter sp. UYP30 TaxID=1756400 RepID=UPI00339ABF12
MQEKKYDVIVIGCGSGGLSVGLGMNALGFNVLMIAKNERDIGGECLNDGCIPSKAMIHIAEIIYQAKQSKKFGLDLTGDVDPKAIVTYIKDAQKSIKDHENSAWLKNQGVDVLLGEAFFLNSATVSVNGLEVTAEKIVLATGSAPVRLKVLGIEKALYYDNESIFNLPNIPKKLLVVGSGPIGIEIGQTMARLGSQVTVVSRSKQILPHEEEEIASILQKQLEKEGIRFHFGAEIEKISSEEKAIVKFSNDEFKYVPYDALFVAIGRELCFDSLKLEDAGIKIKDKKVVVNEYLQTTAKNIYVCGDIAGDLYFSHAAEFHARIIINNFLSPFKKKLDNKHFSWVTFTKPEIATFGYSQKQMEEKSISYDVNTQDFKEDDRALTDGYTYGKLLLYASKKNIFGKQKILGGCMVAPSAGEMIQELILANAQGLSINTLFNKIYPYPTASRVNQSAIVKYRSKNITTQVKRLLKMAFKLFG